MFYEALFLCHLSHDPLILLSQYKNTRVWLDQGKGLSTTEPPLKTVTARYLGDTGPLEKG